MEYEAVVFDNDGILVELVDRAVLRTAAEETFAALGITDPAAEHVDRVVVGVAPDALERVCAAYDVDPDSFWRTRDRLTSAVQRAEMRAGRTGLYDDVDALRSLDVPLGIVSSNQQATVDFTLDHFGTRDLFETAYGREPTVESLRRKKPNTYYLDRALAELDVDDALFVGDSETDLLAAERAGIDSAFVRRSHRIDLELGVTPTYELTGLDELLALERVPTRDRADVDVGADA